jgi:hypothetical protein
MGAPILDAGRGVDRENIVFSRADQGALNHDQAALEARIRTGVVGAQHLELADVLGVNLAEGREPLGGERLVVARPVSSRGAGRRTGRGGGSSGALVSRVRFRRKSTRRCIQRQKFAARLAPDQLDLIRERKVKRGPGAHRRRNDRNKRNNDPMPHQNSPGLAPVFGDGAPR